LEQLTDEEIQTIDKDKCIFFLRIAMHYHKKEFRIINKYCLEKCKSLKTTNILRYYYYKSFYVIYPIIKKLLIVSLLLNPYNWKAFWNSINNV